jgi:hypothetical protein
VVKPRKVEVVEALSRVLDRLHPDDGFDAYLTGIEVLLDCDEQLGLQSLGWLHCHGPLVVRGVADALGIPVEVIPDHVACVDCSANVHFLDEWYMVTDEVWDAGGVGPDDGFLCVTCLESRLGRPLCAVDFKPPLQPIDWSSQSPRLTAAMTRPGGRVNRPAGFTPTVNASPRWFLKAATTTSRRTPNEHDR